MERTGIQKRNYTIDQLQVRGGENGEPVKMSGHAAVFEQWSQNLGHADHPVFEEIKPGAFTRTLSEMECLKMAYVHSLITNQITFWLPRIPEP